MNDTMKDVPAPKPEEPAPKAEMSSKDKFFAVVGSATLALMAILAITDWMGVTRFYSAVKSAFGPSTKVVIEAPKPAPEAPRVETPTPPPAPAAATPVAATSTPPPVAPACNAQEAKPTVVVNCCLSQQSASKPATKPVAKPVPKPAPTEAPKAKEAVVTPAPERIWLWHAHDATASNPKPCIIEYGDGKGFPPYCSALKAVIPRIDGETKHQWLVRVGGGHKPTDTPLYQKKD